MQKTFERQNKRAGMTNFSNLNRNMTLHKVYDDDTVGKTNEDREKARKRHVVFMGLNVMICLATFLMSFHCLYINFITDTVSKESAGTTADQFSYDNMFFIGVFFAFWTPVFIVRLCIRAYLYRVWKSHPDPSLMESNLNFKLFWTLGILEMVIASYGLYLYYNRHEAGWKHVYLQYFEGDAFRAGLFKFMQQWLLGGLIFYGGIISIL